MQFLVPALGTRIRLAADWTFTLYRESRNADLFPLAGWHPDNSSESQNMTRQAYRECDYNVPNGQPPKLKDPITQSVYDFGEPLEEGSEGAYWTKDEYRHHNGRQTRLDCHIEGTTVVIDGPLPLDAERIVVQARRTTSNVCRVTLLAGSLLTLDRYYIRNGVGAYDSITFRLVKQGAKPNARPQKVGTRRSQNTSAPIPPIPPIPPGLAAQPFGRFWVKLDDANTIDFDYQPADQPWWFGLADKLVSGAGVDADVPDLGKVRLEPHRMATTADMPVGGGQLVTKNGSRLAFWTPGNRFGNRDLGEHFLAVNEGYRALNVADVIAYVARPAGALSQDGDVTLAP